MIFNLRIHSRIIGIKCMDNRYPICLRICIVMKIYVVMYVTKYNRCFIFEVSKVEQCNTQSSTHHSIEIYIYINENIHVHVLEERNFVFLSRYTICNSSGFLYVYNVILTILFKIQNTCRVKPP